MSLRKITRQLDLLNQRQTQIENKFSLRSKNNNNYMQEDEKQDKFIYGFTHAETIAKFRQKNGYAHSHKKQSSSLTDHLQPSKSIKQYRPQTVQCRVQRKLTTKKYKFINCGNVLTLHQKNKAPSLHTFSYNSTKTNYQSIRKKSIDRYRNYFSKNFHRNAMEAESIHSKSATILSKKTQSVQFSVNPNQNQLNHNKTGKKGSNFFELTENKYQSTSATSVDVKSAFCNYINEKKAKNVFDLLASFISESFSSKQFPHSNKGQKWGQFWDRISAQAYERQWQFYITAVDSMEVIDLSGHSLKNLSKVIDSLLSRCKLIHLAIITTKNDTKLLNYEQFITAQTSLRKSCFKLALNLLQYYLRIFMFIGPQENDIQHVKNTSKLFFQEKLAIPHAFQSLILEFRHRTLIVRDRKMGPLVTTLGRMVEIGLRQLEKKKKNQFPSHKLKLSHIDRKQYKYFLVCSVLYV